MKSRELTPFTRLAIQIIKKIPKGKVATYGQIAQLIGRPNAARGVVWVLSSCSENQNLPWHRVLNSKGRIAFPPVHRNFRTQEKLLSKEGVGFLSTGQVDLNVFQWKKKYVAPKTQRNKPHLFR